MVSLPGWTFSDSCPFCHLFILFVFCFFYIRFCTCLFVVLCLIAGCYCCCTLPYCCCTLPYCWLLLLYFAFYLLSVFSLTFCLWLYVLFVAVRCCSLLLLFFLLRLLWTFRLCLVPVACCRPLFFVFCAHSGFVLYLLFAVVPGCLFFVL